MATNPFEKICGYEETKRELGQIADCLRDPPRYGSIGAKMPSGVLLAGPPGVGKTLMAESLVEASGLPSYLCRKERRGNELLETIRTAFASAREHAPAIVVLDDLDKFSNCDYDLCDTEEYVTVQSCIDECRGKGVFVVGTANDEAKLPKSLLRVGRFDRIIGLEPPRGEDARAITRHYLQNVRRAEDADILSIADIVEGHSCAFIETLVNEAGLLAGFEREKEASLVHFIRAYARLEGGGTLSELPSADKRGSEACTRAGERAQVAFHEAGHVVVQELLRPGEASLAMLVARQGKLSGLAKKRRIGSQGTWDEARKDLLVALAGGIAVELECGVPCLGCESDIEAATDLARRLVGQTALLGPYYASAGHWPGSESLTDSSEKAIGTMLDLACWRVREMLAANRGKLEQIAGRLYERGYIMPADIESAMDGKPLSGRRLSGQSLDSDELAGRPEEHPA